LEKDFSVDDLLLKEIDHKILKGSETEVEISLESPLTNRNKTVGGQLAIDIERYLNYEKLKKFPSAALSDKRGRHYLDYNSVKVNTYGSAGQSFGAFCNDGLTLSHIGTCNDGVGKGASGGEIIIRSPGGAKNKDNVLIGNFALFGATGGRTFVEGQAGDRFAVRNSGATAVVEGVGDFCAEYMTNGAVLNIGDFAKGFGNGMSGGFAYQFDPDGKLSDMISEDSVLVGTLTDGSDYSKIHEDAIKQLLSWHVNATSSILGTELLSDWETTREKMAWIMPKALLQYQDAEEILSARSRKELVDELSNALAKHQITELKLAWKNAEPVHGGLVPQYGEQNTETMFRLLGSYIVLEHAMVIAKKRSVVSDKSSLDKFARNLILTEDSNLNMSLAKHAKDAINFYDDAGLATLVAEKRLTDFKRALSLRDILSMDSPGTYGWILHQNAKNRDALGNIPSFDELFAQNAIPDVVARTAAE
jgi:glutamate synthase (NADPH/NADH) large chain